MINAAYQYQSYQNHANRLTDYQGFLLDVDREIVKKRPIKLSQGSPRIGTFRVNHSNFQKKSLTEKDQSGQPYYYTSISLDKSLVNISPTELRVEDYYLIRTATSNSDIYRMIHNTSLGSISPFPINKALLHATNVKQPNFGQTVPELPTKNLTASNQFGAFQTPNDRLSKIRRPDQEITPTQLINSINTIKQNSFTSNRQKSPQKQMAQIMDPHQGLFPVTNRQPLSETQMNYFRLNQNSNALDIFLQFFAKQLKTSWQKQERIYPIIETYLTKCFMINERTEQIKMLYLHDLKVNPCTSQGETSKICKKYAECMQMKKLIDGFHKELQGKMARNQFNPNMIQYSHDILTILQDIYSARVRQLYRYSHDQVTEDSLNKIGQALYQKESSLLFKYQNVANNYNPQMVPLPIPFNKQDYNVQVPLHINKSYIDYQALERQQLQNQIFFMNSLNNHLQCLYQRQKLEREEHLYDIVNKYEENVDNDYYLWQRSKRKKTTEIFFIQDQEGYSKELPQSSNKKELHQISSYKVSQFSTEGYRPYWIINFKVQIIWDEESSKRLQLYKTVNGSFQVSQKESKETIEQYLTKLLLIRYKRIIKENAYFKFGELKKLQKTRHIFEISVTVLQRKFNLPSPYQFEAYFKQKDKKGVHLTKLVIWNDFGQIKWERPMNIETLDFIRDSFQIGKSIVQCECECLNIPCIITFYQFSQYLLRLEKKYYKQAIESKMKKYIQKFPNYHLLSIDWNKRHYTISSQEFFIGSEQDQTKQKEQIRQSFQLLKQFEQRFNIKATVIDYQSKHQNQE